MNKVNKLSSAVDKANLTYEELNAFIDICLNKYKVAQRERQQNAMTGIKVGQLYQFETKSRTASVVVRVDGFNIKTAKCHEVVNGQDLDLKKWRVSPTVLRPFVKAERR
jgi:hypothetical protein